MRTVGKVVVLAFPITLGLLLVLPPSFASLVLFAAIYGAANGIITIVRGVVVPEMLTREAYGAINSVLAIPATIAKAISPLGIALLWAAAGIYDSVLVAAFAYEPDTGFVARTKVLANRPTRSALLASSTATVHPVALADISATV